MNKIKEFSPLLLRLFSLLLIIGFSLMAFASLTPQQISVYFNSDTFYLPSIFRDLFIDGSGLKGWNLNAAPNFFPDLFIFSIINALVSDFRIAYLIFSILQVVIIVLIFNAILIQVDSRIKHYHLAISNVFLLLFPLSTLISGDFIFTFYLYSLSYHTGAFVMTLLALFFSLKLLKNFSTSAIIALGAMVFFGTFNDRLFIPTFVFPIMLWLIMLFNKEKARVSLIIISTVIFSMVLGLAAFNLFKNLGYVHIIGTDWKMFNFSNIISSFRVAGEQSLRYITKGQISGVVIVISLLVFIFLSVKVWAIFRSLILAKRKSLSISFTNADAFVLFAWANIPIVWLTPILNGSYVSPAILRFNIHAYFLAILCIGYIALVVIKNQRLLNRTSLISLLLATLLGLLILFKNSESYTLRTVADYYPKRVEAIDSFVKESGVKYGISEYWVAKASTMLSKEDVRIYHVHSNLRIWYHVTNKNWFYKGGKGTYGNPRFEMIVMNGFDSTRVASILGPPLLVRKYPEAGVEIWKVKEFEFDPQTQMPR
jgi:hypothetical protein